jgi:acetoin utilization deacetylase AcuC-like enzyme
LTQERKSNKSLPENVSFIFDPVFLDHKVQHQHPEQPSRLEAIVSRMHETGIWDKVTHIPLPGETGPTIRTDTILSAVHPSIHIELIRKKSEAAEQSDSIHAPFSDGGDTHVSAGSFNAAYRAVQAAVSAVDLVMQDSTRRVFCAVRPPGHHCERMRPMGFCLFNNIAVAAQYARSEYGAGRVAIIDWDVHHGNGTQAIFYDDPGVFFISLHQYPHYPGTGSADERGTGKGEGYTRNLPLPAGTDETLYSRLFIEQIIPDIRNYSPDLILISAGFDAHKDDPLGDILLTENSYSTFTKFLSDVSDVCGGRIISMLEGGYNLHALANSVCSHINALGGLYGDELRGEKP